MNPSPSPIQRRIERLHLCYLETFEVKAGTRAKLQAHAILGQIIDFAEAAIKNPRTQRKAPLLTKFGLTDLVQVYKNALAISVRFNGGDEGCAILLIHFETDRSLLASYKVVIQQWGHISSVTRSCTVCLE